MRIKQKTIDLDYKKTKDFFEKRAQKYDRDNPYSVTMYQDNHPDLVKKRNEYEINKLLPYLSLNDNSKVLDIACGIGRWADAIKKPINYYLGIDFADNLIKLAKERINSPNMEFAVSDINSVENVIQDKKFNVILMIGILMYLNDNDLMVLFEKIEKICEERAIICLREPIGLNERLTLKDFYSKDLYDDYNAIYRTDEEIKKTLRGVLLSKGFNIIREGFLFENEDSLNNRKETAQYFYILER